MLLPILVIIFGTYFLFRLRFFYILHPIKTLREMKKNMNAKGSFKALMLALAGTLGVGNIVGVAFGISVGGAGALFWIWASAFFSSAIKYCESTLASDMKREGHGGMMYVVKHSFSTLGSPLSYLYASICLVLAFLIGAAFQSKSIADSAEVGFGIPSLLVSAVIAVLTILVIAFGTKRIENATAVIIPLATVLYSGICIAVIVNNYHKLPYIISEIFKKAFDFKSAAGGVLGFFLSKAVSEGFARGLLSNEAGAGTSSMAQSRSHASHPSVVGLFGISEIFFDTILLCTLTGFSVLLGTDDLSGSGISIVLRSIESTLGSLAAPVFLLLIFLFAYSTIICWYYYASECAFYLTRKRSGKFFTFLFTLFVFMGPLFSESLVIYTSDLMLFVMTLITLSTLMKNAERITNLSADYGFIKTESKNSDT